MDGISIILCLRWDTDVAKIWYKLYQKYATLDNEIILILDSPTWQTLQFCQENKLKYFLVETNNQYENWNFGAKQATKEFLMFTQEDHHLSPNFDVNILKHMNEKSWGGAFELHVTDSDPIRSCNGQHFCDEEDNILSFNTTKWENFVLPRYRDGITYGDPIDYCIHKGTFEKILGFGKSPYSSPSGHIHHEVGPLYRLEYNLGGARWYSRSAFTLHFKFGCARDLITHPMISNLNPDWGRKIRKWHDLFPTNLWRGDVTCNNCGLMKDACYGFGCFPACCQSR